MSESTQKCPSCSETVPLEYSVCPFCGFGLLEYELRKFSFRPSLKEVFIRLYNFFRHPIKTSEEIAVATEKKGANIILLLFSLFLALRFFVVLMKFGLTYSQETIDTYTFIINAEKGTTFTIPINYLQNGNKLILDLGKVGDIANVRVNESPQGICWKPPYTFNVTDALQTGENLLNVEITNQWTNRIIGDSKLDDERKILNEKKGAFYFFGPLPPLEESGLIGPVTIKVVSNSN